MPTTRSKTAAPYLQLKQVIGIVVPVLNTVGHAIKIDYDGRPPSPVLKTAWEKGEVVAPAHLCGAVEVVLETLLVALKYKALAIALRDVDHRMLIQESCNCWPPRY